MDDPVLIRLLDEARLAQAHRDEERRRLLAGVAAESATFVGTLVDLAEGRAHVSLRTRGGRVHAGVIELVAGDFVVVEGGAGQLWCRFSAIAGIRVGAGSAPASGARSGLDLLLVDALALLVEDRPRIALELQSGESLAGELAGVGVDVLTLHLDGGVALYVSSESLDGILRSG
ncbi:MAG TPA: hypothetical protein VGH94_12095 [Acidimicrobiales bacterium]|jgi:hypothetical protein